MRVPALVIGYYIHHHGRGHLHRARAVAEVLGPQLTGISTLPRPDDWPGDWVELADDADPTATHDPTIDSLHWVPVRHPGLRSRMSTVSAWIERTDPEALVVDVSVEVALLARLHGVPVITMAQPGIRTDPPHTLGYGISDRVIAPWPPTPGPIWAAADDEVLLEHAGAISRFGLDRDRPAPVAGRVVVLNGAGGDGLGPSVDQARAAAPAWEWIVLDRQAGTWVEDPWPVLCSASVVVAHCGQNAVAEIAAARRPAILIPQPRPFDEQYAMAVALERHGGLPVTVLDAWPAPAAWPQLLIRAAARSGSGWAAWNSGDGAVRAAELIRQVADRAVAAAVAR